jgi:formylglycine-generating enzyme required for sulfatase activity
MVRCAPLLLVLALGPGLGAAQDATPLEKARKAVEDARRKLKSLDEEMIQAYQMIKADFDRLRQPGGDEIRERLAEIVEDVVGAIPDGQQGFAESLAHTLEERLGASSLLSPVVAKRYAGAVAEFISGFGHEPAAASRAALERIFPGSDIDDIWDEVFIDLPTVVEWRQVNVALEIAELRLRRIEKGGPEKTPAPEGMVLVPAGKFTFGPHGRPGWPTSGKTRKVAHKESLSAFFIDVHEVTNRQYADFIEARRAVIDEKAGALIPATWQGEPRTFPKGREQYPVTGVTWSQAAAYAKWAKKRLPTEREWEKAARGGEEGYVWPWGDEFEGDALVWGRQGVTGPARVLSNRKDLSPYGVSDMAGNVAEWTRTLESGRSEVRGTPTDSVQIVIRGTSFLNRDPGKVKDKARTYYRWVLSGTEWREHVGFRCVRECRR